jgi:hypothetical protein
MSKLYLDRLRKKYGATGWTGERYRQLMGIIIASNHENVANAVARRSSDYYRDKFARIKKTTAIQLRVPPMEELMPRKEVYLRKGATQGVMITDALRDRLSKELRDAVQWYMGTGKDSMQYAKGEMRGRIKPELVGQFEAAITRVFDGYTKSHGEEMPPNIDTIARTETRAAISDIKHEYAKNLVAGNAGKLRVMKRWIHNDHLSGDPRPGHVKLNGKTVRFDQPFQVQMLRKRGNKLEDMGTVLMDHPHAAGAPAEEIINCGCECDYVTEIIPPKKGLANSK